VHRVLKNIYCIAGKFGGQKIWRIVLEVEKNQNLAKS